MKIVVADSKSGHAFMREIPKDKEAQMIGRKLGEKIEGGIVGMPGYSLVITGGSDAAGFPMRSDIPGVKRTKIVVGRGVGRRHSKKGSLKTRTVSGMSVSAGTSQVNAKITENGPAALDSLGFVFTPKPKAAAPAKTA